MKKLFVLIGLVVFITFPLFSFAEEVTSPVSIINLSTDGSMSARNGTSTFLVNGSSDPLDVYAIKAKLIIQ